MFTPRWNRRSKRTAGTRRVRVGGAGLLVGCPVCGVAAGEACVGKIPAGWQAHPYRLSAVQAELQRRQRPYGRSL
jgi:hypothetical protein